MRSNCTTDASSCCVRTGTSTSSSRTAARAAATRRIDVLALLPAPIGRVWAAKAAFLGASSIVFLAWLVAAQWAVVELEGPEAARLTFAKHVADAVPSLCGAMALGAASL